MDKRREWVFWYDVGSVSAAVDKRIGEHEERVKYWTEEKSKAEAEIRQRGLQFEERGVTGGMRLEAKIDPELMSRAAECRTKFENHVRHLDEFRTWQRALLKRQESLELAFEDVGYFGL